MRIEQALDQPAIFGTLVPYLRFSDLLNLRLVEPTALRFVDRFVDLQTERQLIEEQAETDSAVLDTLEYLYYDRFRFSTTKEVFRDHCRWMGYLEAHGFDVYLETGNPSDSEPPEAEFVSDSSSGIS